MRDIPVLWAGDVAIIGGGSAGCAASLAAARTGASTLVVEGGGFFGGTAVAVLDTMYGFFPPSSDDRVVGGIAWELASSMLDTGHAFLRPNTYGAGTGVTYEPEALKVAWDRLLVDAQVRPLLHSRMGAVVMAGRRLVGVVVLTRRGPFRIEASRFVDATGDADVAWAAGCALEVPEPHRRVQPLTATFRMFGVHHPANTSALHQLMREAAQSGAYRLPRVEGSAHPTTIPGVYHSNMTRVSGIDATDPWGITVAEIEGRRQVVEYVRFLQDKVPGYEEARLLNTSVWIGARETRRLIGRYVLTRQDVLSARDFEDAIARCGAPVEDHDSGPQTIWEYVGGADGPSGMTYGVPYRCLVPTDVSGLLVAGRCLSATHDAHASVRSIAQCLALGQAAGTAAALSIKARVDVRALKVDELRRRLISDGAIV